MKSRNTKHLPLKTRINLVMEYYLRRGTNRELVNKVYRNVIKKPASI